MLMNRPAPLRYRLLAMIYDALVIFAIWALTTLIFVLFAGGPVIGVWFQSLLFFEWFGFFAYFCIQSGQTIGMRAWSLRIIAPHQITLWQISKRFFAGLLGFTILGIGYFSVLYRKDQRTWSDIFSDTQTIRYDASSTQPAR